MENFGITNTIWLFNYMSISINDVTDIYIDPDSEGTTPRYQTSFFAKKPLMSHMNDFIIIIVVVVIIILRGCV